MRKISNLIEWNLMWEESNPRTGYDVFANGDLIGTLRFSDAYASFATAKCADGSWTFKRDGFFLTRVSVRVSDSKVDLATFRGNSWPEGGLLELADGRTFLINDNSWQTKFEFETDQGEPLISYLRRDSPHVSYTINIEPKARSLADLSWMLLLGVYLIIISLRKSESVKIPNSNKK